MLLNDHTGVLRTSEFESPLAWKSDAPEASISDILRVHEYVYVQRLAETCRGLEDGEAFHLDADTLLNNHSYSAARRAAGTVIAAVDAVVKGQQRNAFCAVRPPGHHAGPYGQEVRARVRTRCVCVCVCVNARSHSSRVSLCARACVCVCVCARARVFRTF